MTNRSHRGPRRDSIRWFPSPNSGWRAGGPDAAIIPRNDCHYREREGERAGGRTGQRDWPALRLRFCLVPLADKLRLRTSLLCSGRLRPQPASRCNFASCYSFPPLKTAFRNRSVIPRISTRNHRFDINRVSERKLSAPRYEFNWNESIGKLDEVDSLTLSCRFCFFFFFFSKFVKTL